MGFIFAKNSLIMGGDDGTHVWRAAVANLYCVPVKKLVIFVMRGKVLVEECKELFSNVGGDGCIEWWIEINHIAATRAILGVRFIKTQCGIITTFTKCCFVILF